MNKDTCTTKFEEYMVIKDQIKNIPNNQTTDVSLIDKRYELHEFLTKECIKQLERWQTLVLQKDKLK